MSESSIKFVCLKPEEFISDIDALESTSPTLNVCVSDDEIVFIAAVGCSIITVFKYYPGDILDWKKDDFICNYEQGAFVVSINVTNVVKAMKPLKNKLKKKPKDIVVEIDEKGGFRFIDIDKKADKQNHVHGRSRIRNDVNDMQQETLNLYYAIESILENDGYKITLPFNVEIVNDDIETCIIYDERIEIGYNNRECSMELDSEGINGEHHASILLKDFGEVNVGDISPFKTPFTAKSLQFILKYGKKYNVLKFGDTVPLALMIATEVNGIVVTRGWLLLSPWEDGSY